MDDSIAAHHSPRTQPLRPKLTRAERLALSTGEGVTLEQYRRSDGHVQPLYAVPAR